MEASDRIRKNRAQTTWVYYSTVTLAGQPVCNTNCGATLASTCVTRYTTFEQRYIVADGRSCNTSNYCV